MRKRSKSEIIIDLTSLLDVIFLILMVVICKMTLMQNELENNTKEADIKAEEASALYDEANAKEQLFLDKLDTQDKLNEYVWAVSVYASYSSDKITNRLIRVSAEDQDLQTFELIGTQDKNEESFNALKDYLAENIEDNKDVPVILSLNENDEHILYRDEKRIKQIFEELKNEFPNVYEK